MSKAKANPAKQDGVTTNDIGVRMTISRDVTPRVHAALASLNRYSLSRRVQHLLTLGLEHEERADQAAAVAEHAKLSLELLRRLLNIDELRLGHANPDATPSKQPNHCASDTSQSETKQDGDADAIRRHKMALKLASH